MPTLKSAEKRMRQSKTRQARNLAVRTEIKTMRRKLFRAVAAKKKDEAGKHYREYCSLLDKSAKKGVIGRNTAIRRKGRAAELVRF